MTKPPAAHGTRPRYMAGCHCDPCTAAHSRYCKRYELRSRGRTQALLVDAAPHRAALQRYRDAGWSYARIGRAFNISAAAARDILLGQPHINPDTAARIAAFRGAPDPRPRVPSIGAVRRLRALYAAGHGPEAITAAGGPSASRVRHLIANGQPTIYVTTADAVAAAYQALRDTPGANERARRRARREGWLSPAAWHDDDLDLPEPDIDPVQLVLDGEPAQLTRAQRVEVARLLIERGVEPPEIAARIGTSDRTVWRWRSEYGWKAAA